MLQANRAGSLYVPPERARVETAKIVRELEVERSPDP
jgi:hypothetical protein